MYNDDLLVRLAHRETDAFAELSDRYGWSVYNHIRKTYSDKETADKIYMETMQRFYDCLTGSDCEDPVEALLRAWADHTAYKKGYSSGCPYWDPDEFSTARKVQRLMETRNACDEKKKLGFGRILGIILLILLLTVSIWIIVGFLMEMDILPYYDLGYAWFCSMVEPWLQSLRFS